LNLHSQTPICYPFYWSFQLVPGDWEITHPSVKEVRPPGATGLLASTDLIIEVELSASPYSSSGQAILRNIEGQALIKQAFYMVKKNDLNPHPVHPASIIPRFEVVQDNYTVWRLNFSHSDFSPGIYILLLDNNTLFTQEHRLVRLYVTPTFEFIALTPAPGSPVSPAGPTGNSVLKFFEIFGAAMVMVAIVVTAVLAAFRCRSRKEDPNKSVLDEEGKKLLKEMEDRHKKEEVQLEEQSKEKSIEKDTKTKDEETKESKHEDLIGLSDFKEGKSEKIPEPKKEKKDDEDFDPRKGETN